MPRKAQPSETEPEVATLPPADDTPPDVVVEISDVEVEDDTDGNDTQAHLSNQTTSGTTSPVISNAPFIVRAIASFGDNLTKRDYRPGDVVPWDRERAERYAARGLVVIEE